MVQFKESDDGEPQHSNYWKLTNTSELSQSNEEIKPHLRSKGYRFFDDGPRTHLLKHYTRQEQGMLAYNKKAIKELKAFCRNRNIIRLTRDYGNLIFKIALEALDKILDFPKFMQLPAELRNRICSFSFDTFPTLRPPVRPPICEVFRQLRKETLLLFYKTCTVFVTFSEDHTELEFLGLRKLDERLMSNHYTERLSKHAPGDCRGSIKKLLVTVPIFTPTHWVQTTWSVKLGAGSHQLKISNGKAKCHADDIPEGYEVALERFEQRLNKKLEAIMARVGGVTLQREDLNVFHQIVEEGML